MEILIWIIQKCVVQKHLVTAVKDHDSLWAKMIKKKKEGK